MWENIAVLSTIPMAASILGCLYLSYEKKTDTKLMKILIAVLLATITYEIMYLNMVVRTAIVRAAIGV